MRTIRIIRHCTGAQGRKLNPGMRLTLHPVHADAYVRRGDAVFDEAPTVVGPSAPEAPAVPPEPDEVEGLDTTDEDDDEEEEEEEEDGDEEEDEGPKLLGLDEMSVDEAKEALEEADVETLQDARVEEAAGRARVTLLRYIDERLEDES